MATTYATQYTFNIKSEIVLRIQRIHKYVSEWWHFIYTSVEDFTVSAVTAVVMIRKKTNLGRRQPSSMHST